MGFFEGGAGREALMMRCGNMAQVAGARPVVLAGGSARGVEAWRVANGTGLEFTALSGKCLDIIDMSYKGVNLRYLPKAGIVAPALADMQGNAFMKSISGGMLYTCGLLNVGPACEEGGNTHVFHGCLKNTPMENVRAECGWQGDVYHVALEGQAREAAIFRENLVLRRRLSTCYGAKSVRLEDAVTNEGFEAQDIMLLYHINVGWPVLDGAAELVLPSTQLEPRDAASEAVAGAWGEVTDPVVGAEEAVFRHKMACDAAGNTAAAVVNERLGLGVYVKYSTAQLPWLVQWKSMRAGDYAMGLMPATCFVKGRAWERGHGTLQTLAPGEEKAFGVEIGVLEGANEISDFRKMVQGMREEGYQWSGVK